MEGTGGWKGEAVIIHDWLARFLNLRVRDLSDEVWYELLLGSVFYCLLR